MAVKRMTLREHATAARRNIEAARSALVAGKNLAEKGVEGEEALDRRYELIMSKLENAIAHLAD